MPIDHESATESEGWGYGWSSIYNSVKFSNPQ